MRRYGPIALIAAIALVLAPAAQAKNPCGGGLPAKLVRPSSQVDEFERGAYVRVRPRKGKTFRDVRVKLRFEGLVAARGELEGKVKGPADVPLEFLSRVNPLPLVIVEMTLSVTALIS